MLKRVGADCSITPLTIPRLLFWSGALVLTKLARITSTEAKLCRRFVISLLIGMTSTGGSQYEGRHATKRIVWPQPVVPSNEYIYIY